MAFFGLVFLTGALAWTAAALLQLRRKEGGRVRPHPGGWAAAAVCALNILFMVGLMMFFYFTDFQDLLSLLGKWGACVGCPEDLNGNDEVDFQDLVELLSTWGDCPCPPGDE